MKRIPPWLWCIGMVAALVLGLIIGARVIQGVSEHEAKIMQTKFDEAVTERDEARTELENSRIMIHLWTGIASWYGAESGKVTASGQAFDINGLTGASRTIPLGTMIIVENVKTGRMVPVLINDRGPYITGRGLDVSQGVAERLGIIHKGIAQVRVYELVQGRPSVGD